MIKSGEIWLPDYLASRWRRPANVPAPIHLLIGFMDHYEPFTPGRKASAEQAQRRVEAWRQRFPPLARSIQDSSGTPLQWTFFYPQEEYEPAFLETLAQFARDGLGEVEIHLHHEQDTPDGLRENLTSFRNCLRQEHGLLGTLPNGAPGYVFIHGNWTLCNAHPAGLHCGINAELPILRETGCYCDMTMPAGPHPAQSRTVNSIYYATDRPGHPRSHDRGEPVQVSGESPSPAPIPGRGDLMLIQGPLALNWRSRKFGLLPRIDYGDVAANNPPSPQRLKLWINQHIHVRNRPEWLFIKLHGHGCHDDNLEMILGDRFKRFLDHLVSDWNDGEQYCLHFVTARQMYNIAKAAEAGHSGNPSAYRDFAVAPPPLT